MSTDNYTEHTIGGLTVHFRGLQTLPPPPTPLHILFYTHGRTQTLTSPTQLTLQSHLRRHLPPHILLISLDQRNHGHRLVDPKRNRSWNAGNGMHALDMWSIQFGTARDVGFLMDVVEGFLGRRVSRWGMVGESLGGHATLLGLANDDRLTVGVSFIGCGDYLTLMSGRALKSDPPITFSPVSETHINAQFLCALQKFDPVNRIDAFRHKHVMLLGGGDDRLVPPGDNDRFVEGLRRVMTDEGQLEVHVEEGVGHQVTEDMLGRAVKFLNKFLA
ncbi:Alpha/Beta hydrolase protein [Phlyctochytrium arcticum]|nr:Alpha/Beta hydrolase protein [Phlyctochytrium arcticum]